MALQSLDKMGGSLFSSWQDDLPVIRFKVGEVRNLLIVEGAGFYPLKRHWVPIIKKNKTLGWMAFECQAWDGENRAETEESCEACNLEISGGECSVVHVLDIDFLYSNKYQDALHLWVMGSREQAKVRNKAQFNKVRGVPKEVWDRKHARVLQVMMTDSKDPANKWDIDLGDRIPIKLKKEELVVMVQIPKEADSDYVGKKRKYDLWDLNNELIYPCNTEDAKQRFKVCKVEEAWAKVQKQRERQKSKSDDVDEDADSPRKRPDKKRGSPRAERKRKEEKLRLKKEKLRRKKLAEKKQRRQDDD